MGQGSGHSRTENVPQRSCVQRNNFHLTGKVELGMNETSQCEVYSETTNEWHFIASFSIRPEASPKLSSVVAMTNCMLLAAACGIMVTRYLIQEWNVVMLTRMNGSGKLGLRCFVHSNSFQHQKSCERLFGKNI